MKIVMLSAVGLLLISPANAEIPLPHAPVPRERPSAWIAPTDFSGSARLSLIATVNIVVSPDGKLERCDTDPSTGKAALDARVCELILARASFVPARDKAGDPIYGIFHVRIAWTHDQSSQSRRPPSDVQVTLDVIPAGLSMPTNMAAIITTDKLGQITSCDAQAFDPEVNKALGKIGCDAVIARWTPRIARTAEGAAVSSIQTVAVGFNLSSTKN